MVLPQVVGVIDIGLDPVLVHVGPLSIHWYGLMYVVGVMTGMWFLLPYAEARGVSREKVYAVFWPTVVAALIGGRLYYVVQSNFGWYLQHPQKILATWEGGMAFYGAVLLGSITVFVACRRLHIDFPTALDCAAILIPIAQAIGRVGNLINGDIIGYPSGLPWATRYTNPANTFVPSHTIAYAPAAAYELLFSLALFVLLWVLRFRLRRAGDLFALWLGLYALGQFVLFFGRANVIVGFGLKQAQWTSVVVLVIGTPLWLLWRARYSHPVQRAEGSAEDSAPEANASPA